MDPLDDQPLAETPVAPQRSTMQQIFFGPYGLRAGWGLLIFIAMIVLTIMAVRTSFHLYYQHHPAALAASKAAANAQKSAQAAGSTEMPPRDAIFSHGIPFVLILLLCWIMSRIERRRIGVYGIPPKPYIADFIKGLISGVCALSLLVGLLWISHLLVFTGFAITGRAAFISALELLGAFTLVGFAEEYVFRGYLQYTIARGLSGILPPGNPYRNALGFWLAATFLSIIFFVGHGKNPGESPIGLLSVFLVGLVFSYSLWRTGSLWWAIGMHITWDWAQSCIYGVADSGMMAKGHLLQSHPMGSPLLSGGLTGPEGSLFILFILALLTLVIRFTLPKRPQPTLFPERAPVLPPPPVFIDALPVAEAS